MINRLASWALWAAALALLAMVLVEGWQVVARYVFNSSPSWTEPLALLLINTAMMFSAAVAVQRQNHFSFQLMSDRVAPAIKPWLYRVNDLVVASIGIALSWYGWFMTMDTWAVKLAGTVLRQGAMFIPLTVGGALMAVFAVEKLWSRGAAA